jgi:restriction endonuclease Mrr
LTPLTHDGGSDILAYRDIGITRVLCLVEVKKHRSDRPVGVNVIRTVYGTLCDSGATNALIVTTSTFTPKARQWQDRHLYRLDLKDYSNLVNWIQHYRGRAG